MSWALAGSDAQDADAVSNNFADVVSTANALVSRCPDTSLFASRTR